MIHDPLCRRENLRPVSWLTEWTDFLTFRARSVASLWPNSGHIMSSECGGRTKLTEHVVVGFFIRFAKATDRLTSKKLEAQNDSSASSRVDGLEEATRNVNLPSSKAVSIMHFEEPRRCRQPKWMVSNFRRSHLRRG